jgi:Domain of unknown function (DUF4386)
MSTTVMMERLPEASPRFKARIAGVLYLVSVLTAVFGEAFLRGRPSVAAGFIAVSGMVAATLLFYDIFKPVSRGLSLLAASFNLVCLTLEALRWDPQGVNIAMVFHGLYCLLIGYLIFKSTFLPRILGTLIAVGGLGWLTLLSPPLAQSLSPYNLAVGFLGEGSPMLWLLVTGVSVQRWERQASPAGMDGLSAPCTPGSIARQGGEVQNSPI